MAQSVDPTQPREAWRSSGHRSRSNDEASVRGPHQGQQSIRTASTGRTHDCKRPLRCTLKDLLPGGGHPHMKRREFITLLGGAAAAWPLAARAQQGRAHAAHRRAPRFRLGWIPLTLQPMPNVAIEYRWAEGRSERFAEIAAEFVRLQVDVIVTAGGASRCSKAGDIGHPDRLRGGGRPGRQRAWSRAWRDRAATSPACRCSRPILPASGSNSCARSFPGLRRWRSWPMSAIPPPCWRWTRFRQRPARSAFEVAKLEIRRAEDIAPAFEALKGRADASLCRGRPAREHQPGSHQHLGARARLPTMLRQSRSTSKREV